jgi:hypothetical protein
VCSAEWRVNNSTLCFKMPLMHDCSSMWRSLNQSHAVFKGCNETICLLTDIKLCNVLFSFFSFLASVCLCVYITPTKYNGTDYWKKVTEKIGLFYKSRNSHDTENTAEPGKNLKSDVYLFVFLQAKRPKGPSLLSQFFRSCIANHFR